MLGLFQRCIPVVSKTLKYSARANLMSSRETCVLVPGCSAAEFSRSLESKYHLQLNFCEEWPERAAVTQHSWLSSVSARTPEEQGLACGDRCGILQPRPGSVSQLLGLEVCEVPHALCPETQSSRSGLGSFTQTFCWLLESGSNERHLECLRFAMIYARGPGHAVPQCPKALWQAKYSETGVWGTCAMRGRNQRWKQRIQSNGCPWWYLTCRKE